MLERGVPVPALVLIIGQGMYAFSGDTIDWLGIVVAYIGIPLFLILYFGYKFAKKTKSVKPEEYNGIVLERIKGILGSHGSLGILRNFYLFKFCDHEFQRA